MILETADFTARAHEISSKDVQRRETAKRKLAELACSRAVGHEGGRVVGIVSHDAFGDKYPELWLNHRKSLRPSMFGSSIVNSVIGHCSVVLRYTGPQIVVTDHNVSMHLLAEQQIRMNRAEIMVVLIWEPDHTTVRAVRVQRSLHV